MTSAASITPRFTAEQRAVIEHGAGHALVAAVAGSGKTETLLGRVEELLRRGSNARRILCLMFNKSARIGFAKRLATALPGIALPEVHTFHGHARRIELRLVNEGRLTAADLAADDELRHKKLLRHSMTAAIKQRVGPDAWPDQSAFDDFGRFITLVKAQMESADVVAEKLFPGPQGRHLVAAFALYEKERFRARWRSFDDLLFDTVPLITSDDLLLEEFAGEYDHILVDEMQDMNPIQAQLLRIRAAPSATVMGVGDDDQCLYEFRGADPAIFIQDFERHFRGTRRYTLSRTFRFGHALAMAAGKLVGHNKLRIDKLVVAADGTPNTLLAIHPRYFEAKDLKALRQGGRLRTWSEVLILVRYYAQAVEVELELLTHSIPYEIDGSSGLFFTRIVGGLIALLSFAGRRWPKSAQIDAQRAMVRDLLKLPTLYLKSEQLEAVTTGIVEDPRRLPRLLRDLTTVKDGMEQRQRQAIRDRADLIEMLQSDDMAHAKADEVLALYLDGTRMDAEIRRTAFSEEAAEDDLSMVDMFRRYTRNNQGTVSEILDALGVTRADADETERVRVTTIHRSKGLQSPIVMLPGWESGGFPRQCTNLGAWDDSIEGERRLAYVAMTRAQKELHMYTGHDANLEASWKAQEIPEYGELQASRFAYEAEAGTAWAMERALTGKGPFSEVRPAAAEHARRYLKALNRAETITEATRSQPRPGSLLEVPIGGRVVHAVFGAGTLQELSGERHVARVKFDSGDERLILVKSNQLKPA